MNINTNIQIGNFTGTFLPISFKSDSTLKFEAFVLNEDDFSRFERYQEELRQIVKYLIEIEMFKGILHRSKLSLWNDEFTRDCIKSAQLKFEQLIENLNFNISKKSNYSAGGNLKAYLTFELLHVKQISFQFMKNYQIEPTDKFRNFKDRESELLQFK